ncbi:MAG: RIP metalloprotease RseP [Bacteroidia bacterium]
MEEILIKAAQFLLSLSILIVLHELGHFIPAKLFKTKVEKFYLFFDPWFSLFKIKRGETEYGIGWLPLGGYVKIAGMVDESMDKEQLKQEPQPWEFRSKPAWQRLIIMLGGVIVNILLGFAIYIMVMFVWGSDQLPTENLKNGLAINIKADNIDLKDGDNVIALNGEKPKDINWLNEEIMFFGARELTIQKADGKITDIVLPENIDELIVSARTPLFSVPIPVVIDSVISNTPASRAGLMKGDSIYSVNDRQTPFLHQFSETLQEFKGETVELHIYRKGEQASFKIDVDTLGKIGFSYDPSVSNYYTINHKDYNVFSAIPAGFDFARRKLAGYVFSLKHLFSKDGAKQLGGFATIGSLFAPVWDWHSFWVMTAFLSLILAVMNILPIPALDGGHVMFLLYEMITRRKPNEKVLEKAQLIGMILLFALLIFANGNDIFRIFFK